MNVCIPEEGIFGFVIETAEYAGNFERQMCAYITGRYGECGVGKKEALQFEDEYFGTKFFLEIEDNIADIFDESGCARPCSIFNYGEGSFNSVIIFLHEEPSKELTGFMMDRARVYASMKNISIVGFDLIRFPPREFEYYWSLNE